MTNYGVKKVKMSDIYMDPLEQFRRNGENTGKSNEPGVIEKIKKSIELYGLKNPITVEPTPDHDCPYRLVDGFHRFKAQQRLNDQNQNNPKNPWDSIKANIVSFDSESERRNYKFQQNRHLFGVNSPNTEGDITDFLVAEANDPVGIFGTVDKDSEKSRTIAQAAIQEWVKKNISEFTKAARERVVENVMNAIGSVPKKIHQYEKKEVLAVIKKICPNWDGTKSMAISSDKSIMCGVMTSSEKYVKPGMVLTKLIEDNGTKKWTAKTNIPEVHLFGYVKGAESDENLKNMREQMEGYVKRMNTFLRNNFELLNGRNLINYHEMPQKINRTGNCTEELGNPKKVI